MNAFRLVFRVASVILLAAALAPAAEDKTATLAAAPQAAPPNVVLIVSDDQHWGDFGFMGHAEIRTPHLDRLATEGAVFVNGYVPSSLCRASLATIVTGLYGHQHQICCNDPPAGVDREAMLPFMREAPALPRVLGERLNYRSLQTGKWWEGHFGNGGFTDGMTLNRAGGRHGDAGLIIGRQTMEPVFDFIDDCRAKGERFLVWYAPMMPHEPHDPPERLLAKYRMPGRDERLAKYWAMCEWFDETCGQLLDFLDERKLANDTLVVFVIDNGWIQETRPERRTAGNFAPKSKRSPYDGGLRTPVIVRWPGGGVKPGRHEDLVSTIDLAPTVLEACGLKPVGDMQGLSLLPVATGRDARFERDAVFGEIFQHTAADVGQPALSLTHRWVRAGEWKLIVPERGDPELYNVADDPTEERDRVTQNPDDVARLRRQLDAWWRGRDPK